MKQKLPGLRAAIPSCALLKGALIATIGGVIAPLTLIAQTASNPIVGAGTTLNITSASPGFTGPVNIDNSILLYNAGTTTYPGATVSLSPIAASDIIGYSAAAVPSGVSVSYNTSTQVLSFSGTASASDYQALLRTITVSSSAAPSTSKNVIFTIAGSAVVAYSGTGHYYEFVSGSISWTNAKTAAEGRTLYGLQGYLATATSSGENAFIATKLGSDAWMGGSDNFQLIRQPSSNPSTYATNAQIFTSQTGTGGAEGHWYWVTGPEAGQNFSNGNSSPVTVSGMYANWNNGEPNNSNTEHYLEIYIATGPGRWNDLNGSGLGGYVVEYGGLASDPPATISYTRNIVYTCSPSQTPAISISSTNPCGAASNGSIAVTVTSNTTATHTFSKDAGNTYTSSTSSNPYQFTSLVAGTYSIVAKNSTGCPSAAVDVTLTTSAPSFTKTSSPVSCNGGSDGAISINASGGTSPYTYSNNNGGNFYANSGSFIGLTAGNYTLFVKDASGCVSASQIGNVSEPAVLSFSVTKTNVPCLGGNNGSINVSAIGGTGTYQYSLNGGAYGTSNMFGALAPGSYSVQVTDANACPTTPQTVSISEPATALTTTVSVTNSLNNTAYPMSGQELQTIYLNYTPQSAQSQTMSITPAGGSGSYSYSWKKSACNGSNPATMATLYDNTTNPPTPITTSSYTWSPTSSDICPNNGNGDNMYFFTVTVTDGNGCSASATKRMNMVNPFTGNNVQLCHKVAVRGGSTTQLLTVPPSQVATHLAHGDYLGNCAVFNGVRTVEPEAMGQEVVVYPNPSTGVFVLELSYITEEANISITDVQGKLVAQKTLTNQAAPTATFDLTGLAKGMYLVQVRDGELNYRTKIVIQ